MIDVLHRLEVLKKEVQGLSNKILVLSLLLYDFGPTVEVLNKFKSGYLHLFVI
jgi:hypothetical protein